MIDVVAGILLDAEARVLLAERRHDPLFEGLWEFPGGKIASGETPEAALERELREELGVVVHAGERLRRLEHRYPDRQVRIDFFLVRSWQGRPIGREGQALRWVGVDSLSAAELLPADAPVLAALKQAV